MNQSIPMNDLYAQYKSIKKEIDSALKKVITSSSFVGGPFVQKFEEEMAKFCGTKYAVGVNSGTDALFLSLKALGVSLGDEVITTPFTFFATAEMIMRTGATPVFVDIDPTTFNLDPNLLEKKITKKTKAIIPIHLYGLIADMEPIQKIAKKHRLYIIEDACQAIGAIYKNKKAGSSGKTGCFSFYPTKNLNAWGDGGMITTNDKLLATKLKSLRNHGSKKKYFNEEVGVSSRLDGIQAAILSVKLKHLEKWNKIRQKKASLYTKKLSGISGLKLPKFDNEVQTHIFHQYTLRVLNGKRDALQNFLKSQGISTIIYYPIPLHLLKPLKEFGYKKGDFPASEQASKEVLSLPISPEITDKKIEYVCKTITKFFNN